MLVLKVVNVNSRGGGVTARLVPNYTDGSYHDW